MITNDRIKILDFLQWEDSNGCYTDENCILEEVLPLTYEDAVKYFYGVLNSEYYYTIVDNIFELTYEQVIDLAIQNNFHEQTKMKLERLISEVNPSVSFYRELLN